MLDGVMVTSISLARPDEEVTALFDLLSDDERNRAARFHRERDRRRFIVGRGTLRNMLAGQLGIAADKVPISARAGGKPFVVTGDSPERIHFNVSHCGDVAMFAFADREVGIDVERIARFDDMAGVAANQFSPAEVSALDALAGDERTLFFFRTWVRKEAYLKAMGHGFALDPVPIDDRFLTYDIAAVEGHVAALCTAQLNTAG